MTVQTVLVCEAQVPFVHGGAEVHVRQLVRELRARGYATELVSVPFKWYPKGRDPAARGGVAAARSEREQRPSGRSRDRNEIPFVFRAASEQGGVAHSPVPCGLRAVRHGIQRFRAHGARRRAARHVDAARYADARRMPRALRERAKHRLASGQVQWPHRGAALPSAEAGDSVWWRAPTSTTCCRSDGSNR